MEGKISQNWAVVLSRWAASPWTELHNMYVPDSDFFQCVGIGKKSKENFGSCLAASVLTLKLESREASEYLTFFWMPFL